MALQAIPQPTFVSGKTIWKIADQTFAYPGPMQEPERWVWDKERARRVVHFFNKNIYHVIGEIQGELVELMPWLLAGTCEMFGWIDKETGYRRYLDAYTEVARKNSKTLWNAGLSAYMALADGEKGPEVYQLASTEEQALTAFHMTSDQIKMSKDNGGKLHKLLTLRESLLKIEVEAPNGGKIQALSGTPDGKTGSNPSFVLIDEMHEVANQRMITAMRTGSVGRKQALTSMITTAGHNKDTPCGREHDYAAKVIDGSIANDRYMAIIYAAAPGDDPHSPETWKKANPGLGISVQLDQLKAIHDKSWGKHSGSAGEIAMGASPDDVDWSEFMRYHLNVWVKRSAGYCSVQSWQDCADAEILKGWEGAQAFGGLDLAESIDMNAFGLLLPSYRDEEQEDEEGKKEIIIRASYKALIWYWVCETAAEAAERTNFKYRNYIGHNLEITDGNTADQDLIEKRIVAISKRCKIVECGYDPYNASGISQRLNDKHKIVMTKVRQGPLTLNEPTKTLRDLILRREFTHPNNEVLNWNFRNAQVVKDRVKNEMLSKEHSQGKIDGLAAILNALRCALDSPPPRDPNAIFKQGWTL